jgi:phage tail protein X
MVDFVPFYLSEEGDTVDRIVWKSYGRQNAGLVELVLRANRGVAALGPVLPRGTKVLLPKEPELDEVEAVRLWS